MLNVMYKKTKDGVLIITPYGKIHHDDQSNLESQIRKAIDENKTNSIIINLENLTYISSSGFRIFLILNKEILKDGGYFALANPTKEIESVLKITGLDKIFKLNINLKVDKNIDNKKATTN